MAKFMLSLRDENFQLLASEAQDRGITIQELIRAVIIPDWVKQATTLKTMTIPRPVPGNGNGREALAQQFSRPRKLGNFNTDF